MSHLLEDHVGLCKNIHGHNYKLLVTIGRDDGLEEKNKSEKGMVCDFKFLKKIVNGVIVNPLDHAFAYNKKHKQSVTVAEYLKKKIGQKLAPFPFRVTAEYMVYWMFTELNEFFIASKHPYRCRKIVLYETDTSCATYEVVK